MSDYLISLEDFINHLEVEVSELENISDQLKDAAVGLRRKIEQFKTNV